MLLSYVNTQLRDFYKTLDAFCEDRDVDQKELEKNLETIDCLLYTSPSPRDRQKSRMPSSA